MSEWSGEERRKPDSRLETIEQLVRESSKEQKEFMRRHDLIILGDGDKPGIAGKVNKFVDEFNGHIASDRWMFGAMFIMLGLILKFVVK